MSRRSSELLSELEERLHSIDSKLDQSLDRIRSFLRGEEKPTLKELVVVAAAKKEDS